MNTMETRLWDKGEKYSKELTWTIIKKKKKKKQLKKTQQSKKITSRELKVCRFYINGF